MDQNDFVRLLRKNKYGLTPYIRSIEENLKVPDSLGISNYYMISFDGSNRPRIKDFIEFIASKIIDYSIPRSEIEKARKEDTEQNSTTGFIRLYNKSKNLFTDLKNSGEGGELLLYILVQEILGYPQLLCKMPLKTSSQMHYHGVDGIHCNFDNETEQLSLYWGESKLYSDFYNGCYECVNSISDFIIGSGGSKDSKNRDLQLIVSNIDLIDEDLENAIVNYLDKDHPLYNKVIFKGVCLVGYDYEEYPKDSEPNRTDEDTFHNDIKDKISEWQNILKNQLQRKAPLDSFEINFFLIPFPSVEEYRRLFLEELGI